MKTITVKTEDSSENPDPIDQYVGERLRKLRTLLKISQEQMGNAVGLTFQQIQKYERAANRISASRLLKLGKLLNVPVSYFFEGYEDKAQRPSPGFSSGGQESLKGTPQAAPQIPADVFDSRETMELLRTYYSIKSPKKREAVISLINSMFLSDSE
jgi:transcriptional regulator with XRE-family HTH domain